MVLDQSDALAVDSDELVTAEAAFSKRDDERGEINGDKSNAHDDFDDCRK